MLTKVRPGRHCIVIELSTGDLKATVMNTKHDVWAVVAAIFIRRNNSSMHIEDIVEDVCRSNLTVLGCRGSTPRQSVSPQLTNFHSDKFESTSRGFYALANPDEIRRNPKVQRAMIALDALLS